jgi:DNA invertase Pin-like site-specific DNA recombinase
MASRGMEAGPDLRQSGELALGYVRLDPSAGSVGLDLASQAEAIERACSARGLHLCELVRDPGSSPSHRPGLEHARERIVSGGAGALVVARLALLGGTAASLAAVLRWCQENGIRVIADDLELDSGSEGGRLAARALIAAGELEHSKLSESTRRGLAAARQKGATGRPSVADRPELLKLIIELRLQGLTLQAIADQLNADGVPTLRGGAEWRPSSVQAAARLARRRANELSLSEEAP